MDALEVAKRLQERAAELDEQADAILVTYQRLRGGAAALREAADTFTNEPASEDAEGD